MTGAEHAVARQTVNVSVALESEVAACSVFGETQLSVAHTLSAAVGQRKRRVLSLPKALHFVTS